MIPRKYQGVSFDRPPVTQMDELVVRQVRSYCAAIDENLDTGAGCGSWAAMEPGRRPSRCSSPRRHSGSALGGHLLPSEAAGPNPPNIRRGTGEQSYSDLFERLATVDLLHLDDLGAEKRTEWVLEQLYAVVNERYERQRSLIVTTNVEPHDLEKQLGARVVSRLVEMCGDPVTLFDDDRRMRVSADVATSLGESGGSALGPLDH